MKILIVTGIFPPDIGGPATYVPLIAGALAERGYKIMVLTTSEPQDLAHDDSRYPFPVVRLNRRLPLWRRTLRLIRLILRHGREADVIYANGMHLETALANKLLRRPLVMKIVGDEAWERATRKGWTKDSFEAFQQRRQSWPAELNKHLRSWATRQADKVIVPSQYLKRFVTRWGMAEEKCIVVYNAVEAPADVKPAALPLQTPVKLVTVGRLIPLKGVGKIIELLPEIDEAGLVIIGDGPEKPRLETLTRSSGLDDRVYFAGQRSKKETLALMAACDIFVLNSSYEGLPHVIVEAIQLGLPVVATAVGGIPEIIRDDESGLLIPPNDREALKNALLRLINNPDLRRMLIEKGWLLVQTKFNKEGMIDQTEALLLKAAKNFSRSSIHAAPENHPNSPIDR